MPDMGGEPPIDTLSDRAPGGAGGGGSIRKLAKDHPVLMWGGLAVGVAGLVFMVVQAKNNQSNAATPSIYPVAGPTGNSLDTSGANLGDVNTQLQNGFSQLENQQNQFFSQFLAQMNQGQQNQQGSIPPGPGPSTPPGPAAPPGPRGLITPGIASGAIPPGPSGLPNITLSATPAGSLSLPPSGSNTRSIFHQPPQGGTGGAPLPTWKTPAPSLAHGEEVLHV